MHDIIRASGLSAGAVYGYFSTKDELIVEAVTTSLSSLAERLAGVLAHTPPLPPEALLGSVTGEVAEFARRDGYDLRRIALLGWSEAQRNPRLKALMKASYGAFRERLVQISGGWKNDGTIAPDADDRAVAALVLSAILGFVVQSAILEDIDREAMATGLQGLRRR